MRRYALALLLAGCVDIGSQEHAEQQAAAWVAGVFGADIAAGAAIRCEPDGDQPLTCWVTNLPACLPQPLPLACNAHPRSAYRGECTIHVVAMPKRVTRRRPRRLSSFSQRGHGHLVSAGLS